MISKQKNTVMKMMTLPRPWLLCLKISTKFSNVSIETTKAVRGIENLAVAQLMVQHQEGTLHLTLAILIQVLETDRIQATTLTLMQGTRQFSAVNLKKKNKPLNATWSDGDSDCSREDDSNLVAFASRTDDAGGDGGAASSKNTTSVTESVLTLTYESTDDEDLTEQALIEAYRLMHRKWTELTKCYEKISSQNQQLKNEKNHLQKHNSEFESKLKESQISVATLNAELEKMKMLVKMLNSGSSKLDEILSAGTIEKEHFGLGYTGQAGNGQTAFVKGTSCGSYEENNVRGKRAATTPIRNLTIMAPRRISGVPPGGTPGKRRNWVPIYHYCNKRCHIRPRCFRFL